MDPTRASDAKGAADHHENYKEYNKALRTWLVAFGIGGPVLLLTRENILDRLSEAGCLRTVAVLFLLGVAAQVLIAAVNKMVCWYCYYAFTDVGYARSGHGRFMLWLDSQFYLDLICDLVSIAAFAVAICLIFRAFV